MPPAAKAKEPVFERVPRHVAIIMDGNGRWAAKRKKPRIEGHKQGATSVEETVREAVKLGISYLTLYAFSVENWNRPKTEVAALMRLLVHTLKTYEKTLMKENVRLQVIGRLADLSADVRRQLDRTIEVTSGNTAMTLVLALSYSGRVEMVEACRALAEKVKKGQLSVGEIDEKAVSDHLYTADIPDPDLLIRTSGEMRLSNFLLWQLSYTELHITPVFWPDFRGKNLRAAVEEFNNRQRRFGGV